jgi:hypothetical protein
VQQGHSQVPWGALQHDGFPLALSGKSSYSRGARFFSAGFIGVQEERWNQMTKVLRGVISLVGAAAILAVSAATAFAGGYASGGVEGQSTGGGGTLPFTGAELALYVVIGLAIVASGLALRAYSARRVR